MNRRISLNTALLVASLPALAVLSACSSGIRESSPDDLSFTPLADSSYKVVASADDAEEETSSGNTYIGSPVLELGEKDTGAQSVGVRFQQLAIPQGATVNSARLEFTAALNATGTADLTIQGHASDSSPAFAEGAGTRNVSSRAKAIASKSWTPAALLTGEVYKPDVTAVVQAIVNRSGWSSGNAMAFMISGTGQRKVHAFDGNSALAPRLIVTYDAPSTSTSCLENVNRVVANPTANVQYTVRDKGTNVEIDARGKSFVVENQPSNGSKPLQVQNNGSDLCISGGIYDTDEPAGDNADWDDFHYGVGIYVSDSENVTFDNILVRLAGDAFSFHKDGSAATKWTLRDSYIRHAGDDAIENDNKLNGLLDDVLIDWAYMGISCRAGAGTDIIQNPAGTITIQDSLVALKRQVGTFGGINTANPSHLFMFKMEKGSEPNCKLRLRNTVFYMQNNNQVFDSLQNPSEYVTECSNVTLVYAGSGTYSQSNRDKLQALKNKFSTSNCFNIVEGSSAASFWQGKRSAWFDRHTDNAQISYYRTREPQGAQPQ